MSSSSTAPPPVDPRSGAGTPSSPGERQPNLFDPDDASLDRPVPYVLTGRGRRLVDPAAPRLRVVDEHPRGHDPAGHAAVADVGVGDLADELGGTDGPVHARVRALQHGGAAPDEIAEQLGLDPLTVRVWTAPEPATGPGLPGPPGPAGRAPAPPKRPDQQPGAGGAHAAGPRSGGDWDDVARPRRDERGLALLAAIGELEAGGVVATTNRIVVARELVGWLRARHAVTPGAVRVVLRVADHATADLVGNAWADQLGLGRDRVLTVPWRAAPSPRAVQAVVRITGRDLAGRLGRQLSGWPSRSPDEHHEGPGGHERPPAGIDAGEPA